MQKDRGSISLSALAISFLLTFVVGFIFHPSDAPAQVEKGSVQGEFIAQGPTLTPRPSPYMNVKIINRNSQPLNFAGATVCTATWGGASISTGYAVTTNCQVVPSSSSFTFPFDPLRSYGGMTGLFLKPPAGWRYVGAGSPQYEGDLVSDTLKNTQNETGIATGFYVGQMITTGYYDYFITFDVPSPTPTPIAAPTGLRATCSADNKSVTFNWTAAPGAVNYGVVVSYDPFGAAQTRAAIATSGITYNTYTYWDNPTYASVKYRVKVNPIKSSTDFTATGLAATVDFSCPYAPTPTVTPTRVVTVAPTVVTPTTIAPTSAPDCRLQPKGDADCNGTIDSADYVAWKLKYLGQSIAATLKPDFNADSKVSLIDLEIWVRNQGATLPTNVPPTTVPVTVAPTSSIPFDITKCTPATNDTYVSEKEPTLSFGTSDTLRVGGDYYANSPSPFNGTNFFLTYLKFDVSKIASSPQYELWMYQTKGGGAGSSTVYAYPVTQDDTFDTSTWNSRPGIDYSVSSRLGEVSMGDNFALGWTRMRLKGYNAKGIVLMDYRWSASCATNRLACGAGASRGSTIGSKENATYKPYLCPADP